MTTELRAVGLPRAASGDRWVMRPPLPAGAPKAIRADEWVQSIAWWPIDDLGSDQDD